MERKVGGSMAQRAKSTARDETQDQPKGWTRRVMSRDEITVRQGIQAHDEERKSHVAALKTAVWNGTYDPNIDEVADAMLTEREAECAITRAEEHADQRPQAGANG